VPSGAPGIAAEGETSGQNVRKSDTTAAALGQQYGVDEKTIRRDGEFAEAVDELEEKVRKDLREVVTKRKGRQGEARSSKGRVARAGKAVKERRVTPMPFMQRAEWKDYQVIEAIDLASQEKTRNFVRWCIPSTVDETGPLTYLHS
jgi:hypothetical protein